MKLKRINLFKIPPRWLFLRLETDSGLVGWGEPIVEGKANTVSKAVQEIAEMVLGQDCRAIEDIWQKMYRGNFYRGGPVLMSAIAGIDQALWDIKGKYFDVPVYELLGGPVRDKIECYSWIGGDRPEEVVKEALERKNQGFQAVKMNVAEEMHYLENKKIIDLAVDRIKSIREELNSEFKVAIDFHGRAHKAVSKKLMKALSPFDPFFYEEPVLSENWQVLNNLDDCGIPVALGERLYSRWDFKEVINSGLIDIIQPDPSHAGGITEVKKIADMAEANDIAVALHCPLGPISLAAALQLDAIIPNAFIQEQSGGIHYQQEGSLFKYLNNHQDFTPVRGYLKLPDKPGLGIEIDEDMVKKESQKNLDWRNPVWRNHDGTITEW